MLGRRFPGVKAELEDVEQTQLKPYKLPLNCTGMVGMFAGAPVVGFKDKKVNGSKWRQELSIRQVLYAAFDVCGLHARIPCFPDKGTRMELDLVDKMWMTSR